MPGDSDHQPEAPVPPRRKSRRATIVVLALLLLLVTAVGGVTVWALGIRGRTLGAGTQMLSFEQYRAGWESAMQKAEVEAAFPPQPVDLADVGVSGRRPFQATFTAEELTALLNVYRHTAAVSGSDVSLQRVEVALPTPGAASLKGRLVVGSTAYSATIEGPVTYAGGEVNSPGATSLRVEGFNVGGSRRAQATRAVLDYLNAYLDAAPGLTIDSAEIVSEGVRVTGSAPQRIEHREDTSTP